MRRGTVLHADLDAFLRASVEQLLDPSPRASPIAVGGGVVLAASYEAKAFGVRGGMSGRRARELCPQLHVRRRSLQGVPAPGRCCASQVLSDFHAARSSGSPLTRPLRDVAGCEPSLWRRLTIDRQEIRRAACGRSWGCRSRSAWHAPSISRKIASQVAKPDGLVVVDPAAELRASCTTCLSS